LDKLTDIKNLIRNIKTIYSNDNKCGVLPSNPKKYKFKPLEITLRYSNDIAKKLLSLNYGIKKQIVNYNGKCIGLLVVEKIKKESSTKLEFILDKFPFMLPIYPSSILEGTDIIFIDDETLLINYTTLKKKLFTLYDNSSFQIPCKPVSKVLDRDKNIVGIITETKQFIPVETKPNTMEVGEYNIINTVNSDDLFLEKEGKLFYSDAELLSAESNINDIETNLYIKKIKLENRFYDCFRNIIRIEINKPSNLSNKKELLTILNNKSINYDDKVSRINIIIKKIHNVCGASAGATGILQGISIDIFTGWIRERNNISVKEKGTTEKQVSSSNYHAATLTYPIPPNVDS